MMKTKRAVRVTANFERNLERIRQFLVGADAAGAYEGLLDELLDKVIPTLEQFPEIGADLLSRPAGSVETASALKALGRKARGAQIRQYVLVDYLLLYALTPDAVTLLAIRHHRQLSFDLNAIWLTGPGG